MTESQKPLKDGTSEGFVHCVTPHLFCARARTFQRCQLAAFVAVHHRTQCSFHHQDTHRCGVAFLPCQLLRHSFRDEVLPLFQEEKLVAVSKERMDAGPKHQSIVPALVVVPTRVEIGCQAATFLILSVRFVVCQANGVCHEAERCILFLRFLR